MSLDFDLLPLLEPFDGESPCGTDFRLDDDPNNAYRRIRDLRNDAKEAEDRADLDGESPAEARRFWNSVWSDGLEYLQTCAKDLEIVAYMIEASVRLDGFSGLAASLRLTRELVLNFWGELFPTPDEDGIETTLLPVARLNSDAITYALQRIPVTADTSVGEIVLWQYGQARRLDTMSAEERERQISRGAITMEVLTRSVAESPDEFFLDLCQQIEEADEAVTALETALKEKAGEADTPNFSRFQDAFREARSTVRVIAGDRLEDPEAESDAEESDASGENPEKEKEGGGIRGGISSRSEALDVLEKVALWFERHEPQSILISEIRKVKRRALMTPEQLYNDLISDSSVREQLFRDVGIETTSSDEYE